MADSFDLTWNGDDILNALEDPFNQTNELLGRNFQKQITSDKWRWPDGGTRDIVDTGQLRNSYQGFPAPPFAYDHEYNVSYSLAVHEGAVFDDGHSMPARPWIRVGLREFDFAQVFTKIAERKLNGIR